MSSEYSPAEFVALCAKIRDICYAGGVYTHNKDWLRWNLSINAGHTAVDNNELINIVQTNNLIAEYLNHLFKTEYKENIAEMYQDEDLWHDDPCNPGVYWLQYVQVSAAATTWAVQP